MDERCCSALALKRRTAANDNDRKTIAGPAGIRTGCGSSRPARRRHDHENSPQQGVCVFIVERRGSPYFEPLMEWIGDDDPLVTVELSFPTLAAAILCANRQRLSVRRADHPRAGTAKMKQAFWDETFGVARTRCPSGQLRQGRSGAVRPDRSPRRERLDFAHGGGADGSMDGETDGLDVDRILIDQAIIEGMPGRPSLQHEVQPELLALRARTFRRIMPCQRQHTPHNRSRRNSLRHSNLEGTFRAPRHFVVAGCMRHLGRRQGPSPCP